MPAGQAALAIEAVIPPPVPGLIRDQSDHITAGDRPSGLERVETFHPRERLRHTPLAVDGCQLFAEETIVFNLPGIEIGTSYRLRRIRGFRLDQDPGRDLGRPEIRPLNGLTCASSSSIWRCKAGLAATTQPP